MTTSRLAAVCFGLLAIFGAACSPSPEEARAERERDLAAAFSPSFTEISENFRTEVSRVQDAGRAALAAGGQDAVIDVYRSLRDATKKAAQDFENIEPPSAVVAQHESLVANLREQEQALDDVVNAGAAQQDPALTDALREFASLLVDFATIHESIDTKLAQGP